MNDMERIQRGLEEFLRQQQQETQRKTQKEIDIIGTNRRDREYEADWDSGIHRNEELGTRNRGRGTRREESGTRKSSRSTRRSEEPGTRRSSRGTRSEEYVTRKSSRGIRREEPGTRNTRRSDSTIRKSGYGIQTAGSGTRRDKSVASKSGRRVKKKKFSFKRFLFTVALVIALLAAGLYWMVGQVYSKLNYHEIESVASSPMKENGVINILLIGNDSRQNGEDGRSDAMILLSVSTKTKKIYMTSLLRDMYVEIPGHDNNRLNAAYSFGGAELLMETVEQNLDITVNRYMSVNFEAFANLVDAVGGVDLELSSAEIEWVNAYLNEYNLLTEKEFGTDYMDPSAEGMVHLNGPQALAYTRNRYMGTDFGRTERQRKVLTEVVHGLPKALLLHPGELADGLMPNLTTNLTQWECYRLSLMAPQILSYDIEQGSIPMQGTYRDASIRGMAVLEVDFETNKEHLHKLLFEPQEED